MVDDDMRKRALRKSIEQLDAELGEFWGDIAHRFGEHSREMCELHTARKSCDLVTMQRTLESLRLLVKKSPQEIELDRRLTALLSRAGDQTPLAARLRAARTSGDLEEMRMVAEAARRELAPSVRPVEVRRGPRSLLRPERHMPPKPPPVVLPPAGPESFADPYDTKLPLPPPQRAPRTERPEKRRATPRPQPPVPLGLRGVARRCSCGNELVMATDYVCYQCKPR